VIKQERAAQFVAGLRSTLVSQASAQSEREKEDSKDAVAKRQSLIEESLAKMDALQFDRNMSDDEFWRRAASKPFYAGHRAADVQSKEQHMLDHYLGDRLALCAPEWNKGGKRYNQFLTDEGCFRNEPDLNLVITAARTIERLKSFNPDRSILDHIMRKVTEWESTDALREIHAQMHATLKFGLVTTFHLMTELGFPVVKPDRVVNRAAIRMGVIEEYTSGNTTYPLAVNITTDKASALGQRPEFNWALQEEFRKLSQASGMAMRTLDFVIVKLGQEPDEVNGFARTVCAEQAPLCHICAVKSGCAFANK
jgi:DNA-3-methyladenine glycosylase I